MYGLLFGLFFIHSIADPGFDGKIRPNGDGSFVAYMIPPFQSNHASFIEVLPGNTLTLGWFSGKKEGANDVAIVLAELNTTEPTQWSRGR